MRIRREEASRALEILEDYHGRLFAPEDSDTRDSIQQIIRIFKSDLFQALLDIHDVYEESVRGGDSTADQEARAQNPELVTESQQQKERHINDSESISARDVEQLFSPGKLNQLLGVVLEQDKKRQLEQQNHLQVKQLSTASSPLPLESIGEAPSESESSSSNFDSTHDYYPNGQPAQLNGSPEIISRSKSNFSPVLEVEAAIEGAEHLPPTTAEATIIKNCSTNKENGHIVGADSCEGKQTVDERQNNINKGVNGFVGNGIATGSSYLNGATDQQPQHITGNHQQQLRPQSRQSSTTVQSDRIIDSPSPVPSTANMSMPASWEYEEVIIDRGSSGLGFSIAGGADNPHVPDDNSIYITKVIQGGAASMDGRLQVDDIILKVNDQSLVEIPHATAVEALKVAGTRVHLFVKRRKAMIPPSASAPANMGGDVVHVELFKTASKGLGFSIAGGIGNQHVQGDNAIYITKVMEKGAAAQDGRIEVGDKLVAVNDIQLENVTHEEAVGALKSSSEQVVLTIRKPPLARASGSMKGSIMNNNSPIIANNGHNSNRQLNSQTLTRTSLQSLPVSAYSAAYDERSQTLPMSRQALQQQNQQQQQTLNKQTQQSNNVYNHSQNRLTKSSEGVDVTDMMIANNINVTRDPREVILTKSPSGLGFNIVGGEDGEGIFISFILAGGAADQCEQIFRGDQVLEVNGVNLRDSTHQEAAQTLKTSGNTVSLLLMYKPEEFQRFEAKIQDLREQQNQMQVTSGVNTGTLRTSQKKTLYVRALFDYEPIRDSGLPSRGLMFRFGDILHVTNASDDEWWQARRVLADGRDDTQIGIIPSKRRVERRERARVKSVKFNQSHDYSDGSGKFPSSGTLDRKKKNFSFSRKFPFMKSRESSQEDISASGSCDHLDTPENNAQPDRSSISGSNSALEDIREDGLHILSYEVVHTIQISYVRPIILLGPLKEQYNDDLISEYPDRFTSIVPHTTREQRPGEVDGRDYFFVHSREQMEKDIEAGVYVEAGQYKNNLYGTAISSVRETAFHHRKHCILDVSSGAIRRLIYADIYPIAVLIRPKSIDQLREWDKRMSEEEARSQFEKALQQEAENGELFTAFLCCDTPEDMYSKLKLIINDNYGPTIWVPNESEVFDEDDESSEPMLEECSRNILHSKRRLRRKQQHHNIDNDDPASCHNDNESKDDEQSEEVDSDQSAHLLASDMIEILKNYAACKEKLFRWEQSKNTLQQAPDSDPNKRQLAQIINFADGEKSCTRDKAIFLYEQLGQKCSEHKNFIGAAKAFERAASLRYDLAEEFEQHEPTYEDVTATVSYLEAAIENYAAIHKYKHAGTLHYRCSRILRKINAPHQQVDRHHERALEYFTKPDHELKNRKRVDGLKISCYSSYSSHERMHSDMQSLGQHTTTTTTTTNMIKFHTDNEHDDDDDDDVSNDSIGRHTSIRPAKIIEPLKHNKSLTQSAQYFSHSRLHTSSYSSSSCSNDRPRVVRPRISDEYYHCNRSVEHRIEAAQKLVKKLRRQFPFYEVSASGPEKGRVYCRVCKRYLGAVSSTLKNHANTQEHQQAVQEEEEEQREMQKKLQKEQSSKNNLLKSSADNAKKRKVRPGSVKPPGNPYKLAVSRNVRTDMVNGMPPMYEIAPDLRDIELQPLTPSFSGHFENRMIESQAPMTFNSVTSTNMYPSNYMTTGTTSASASGNMYVSSEMYQMNSMNSMNLLNPINSYT